MDATSTPVPKTRVMQVAMNSHSGTLIALMEDGALFERDLDPRPSTGPQTKRYRWTRVPGPLDEPPQSLEAAMADLARIYSAKANA